MSNDGGEKGCDRMSITNGLLVIVPCGLLKIWDKIPAAGPTEAKDCFPGPVFKANREFAERFGEAWVVLSAKYGFIEPSFVISHRYHETFRTKASGPVSVDQLRLQIKNQRLDRFSKIIGLGREEYRRVIEQAFVGINTELFFPFSKLTTGKVLQATSKAIYANDPFFSRTQGPNSKAS